MAMVALEIPPGVVRRGTELESAGRWYDTNLVRWNDQSLQPIGGWRDRTPSSTITGTPSSIFAYTDNNPHRHIAFGCESKLYALDQGFNLSDITPASMATGRAVSTNALGYGTRNFGEDEFGTPRPQTEDTGILDATSWSMDSWGAYLLACADTDGRLLQWTNTSVSAPLTNAPTSCKGLVVTDERFVFAGWRWWWNCRSKCNQCNSNDGSVDGSRGVFHIRRIRKTSTLSCERVCILRYQPKPTCKSILVDKPIVQRDLVSLSVFRINRVR